MESTAASCRVVSGCVTYAVVFGCSFVVEFWGGGGEVCEIVSSWPSKGC